MTRAHGGVARLVPFATAVFACALLASCSSEGEPTPLTQIVVVVDSDFSGLTRFEAEIEGFEEPETVTAELEDSPLPRRFTLVHDGGPLGPIDVTVRAYVDDADEPILIEPRTNMRFVRGETRLLKIDLLAVCIGLCDMGEACVDPGECVSSDDAAELLPWDGPPDGLMVGGPYDGGTMMDGSVTPPMDAAMDADDEPDADRDSTVDERDADEPDDADVADADDGSGEEVPEDAGDTGMPPDPTWSFVPHNVDLEDPLVVGLDRNAVVLDCGLVEINSSDVSAAGFCDDPPPDMIVVTGSEGGGEVLVVAMSSLQIVAGSTLRLRGSRPIVLLVEGDVFIEGTIDASAQGIEGGPGAGIGCETSVGVVGNNDTSSGGRGASGGGGGGFGSAGGNSGSSNTTASAAGGMAIASSGVPLRGGCPGGNGGIGESGATAALGGGGGGAVQLSVAGLLTLPSSGVIRAAGGGGERGGGAQGAGAGGGSGGLIVLEAETYAISASAVIAVNGGGGGGGQPVSGDFTTSTPGADGTANTTPATRGTGSNSGGDGGYGAAFASGATNGENGGGVGITCPIGCNYGGGGGGGGGVGRIVLRGATSCAPVGVFSPAPSVECESCGACPAMPELSCSARVQASDVYALCVGGQSWTAARASCVSVGLDLAQIDTQVEHDFVVSQLPADTWFWMGAADQVEDDWRWVADNSQFWSGDENGDPVGSAFEAWRSGDPQGLGDCGRISSNGWADQDCDDPYGYICE